MSKRQKYKKLVFTKKRSYHALVFLYTILYTITHSVTYCPGYCPRNIVLNWFNLARERNIARLIVNNVTIAKTSANKCIIYIVGYADVGMKWYNFLDLPIPFLALQKFLSMCSLKLRLSSGISPRCFYDNPLYCYEKQDLGD